MSGKTSRLLVWGAACLLCSCIDNTYDLKNKEVLLDVNIEGNKIALPLGNLKPIYLDSMLNLEGQEMLKNINGVYSIAHKGYIEPIKVKLDEISFTLDDMAYREEFNFEEAGVDIDEVTMPGKHEVVEFDVTDVSIEDINEALPQLQEKAELDVLDSDLIEKLGTPDFPSVIAYTNSIYTLTEEDVKVDFEYLLPKEVKTLHEVQVVNSQQSAGEAAVFHFKIKHPHILSGLNRTFSFQVEFPETFDVALYPKAEQADRYQLNGRMLTVKDMPVEGDVSLVEFYFKGFTGLEDEAYYGTGKHDDGSEGRLFALNDVLSYTFDYHVDGDVEVKSDVTLEDFQVAVELDADLGLYDVIGETNPIEFDFDDEAITFSTEIENLEHISEVKYVRLDPQASQVRLTIDMPETFEPFELSHGESFKIHLPEFLYLNEQLSSIPEGMTYDAANHTIHVLDDDALDNAAVILALETIEVNQKVVDGRIAMSGAARLTTGGSVFFASKKASLRNDLPMLRDKEIHFDLEETRFVVDEVVVVSEAVAKELHEVVDIEIDEPLVEGLDKIYSVDFKEDVSLDLMFELSGLDDVKGMVDMRVEATLPSFICLETSDGDVKIEDGVLSIDTEYTPGQVFKKSIKVTHFDFTKMENGCLTPTIEDGKTYLRYTDSIVIDATVSVDQVEVSSDILDRTAEVDFEFAVSPIVVSRVEGIYNGEVDKMSDSFDLDLGEELAFLKEEGNGLTLSDPQIMIGVENSLNVPFNVDVIITGRDDNGEVIETAHIVLDELPVNPATFDDATGMITPDSTRYLFVSREGRELQGYNTVVVPQLATLLQKLPSSVAFEIVPKVDTTATHRVNLCDEMQISGDYSIIVPLMFDDLSVCYTDTIVGMQMELEDVTEIFSNLGFSVYMDVNNTLPIGLEVELTAIDVNGAVMQGVVIDPVSVKAGDGSAVGGAGNFESVRINAQCMDNADLNVFDGLIFSINAKANETIGGAALKPEQGIHIKNIVVELRGDIDVDLNELKNKTDE